MKILSKYLDKRINSINIFVETTFGEYLSFARGLIDNNEFQRNRVRSSKTVYSLLKDDLIKGCMMPPLVLAIRDSHLNTDELDDKKLISFIMHNTEKVSILDGLQRTYTLMDAKKKVSESRDIAPDFDNHHLRLEIYVNINRFGVLYRMLTLNTGQTPMSARHQLEMLYHDYLNIDIDGIKLISDRDGHANPSENEFKFNDVISGFISYTNRDEKLIDRQGLLDNICMVENMAKENIDTDLFLEFTNTYVAFFKSAVSLAGEYKLDDETMDEYMIDGNPFGRTAAKIFSSSQSLTGFGSAIGIMKERKMIAGLDSVKDSSNNISGEANQWVPIINKNLDIIRKESKKIGNAQRLYFNCIFRCLFDDESEGYLDMIVSVNEGYERYKRQAY